MIKGYIYKITNRVNNKVYIGQTKYTIEHRWKQHLRAFKEGRNNSLYKAMLKYGIDSFIIEPLEEVEINKLDEREIFWIAKYDSFKKGYNMTKGGQDIHYIWTDNQYEEIKDLYLSGFSAKFIGERFNASGDTVLNILRSLNIKLRRKPLDINRVEKNIIISDYKSGFTLASLAKRLNTDRETIKRFLIKEGVDLRVHGLILKDGDKQRSLIEDFTSGMRLADLEQKYHADVKTIKRVLSLNGIDYKMKRGLKQTARGSFCLSDTECLECIKLYNSGMLMRELARKFNINISTLYSLLDKYHIKRRYNSSKSVHTYKNGEDVLQ